jgi:tetratricopeptide (TPR) repeat protein
MVHGDLEQHDVALEQLQRARDLVERGYGSEHPTLAGIDNGIGGVHRARGEFEAARRVFARAVKIAGAAGSPAEAQGLTLLGLVELDAGNPAAALEPLERGLARHLELEGQDPVFTADAQFGLARALWAARGDRQRARELAERARAAYSDPEDVAEIDAWVKARD